MRHIDDDLLALIALQSEEPDPDTTAHLDGCALCRDELAGLVRTVRAGRRRPSATDLTSPPDHVWDAVVDALTESGDLPAPASARPSTPGPGTAGRRRMPTWLAVAAGVVIGAVGTGIAVTATEPAEPGEQPESVIAAADLDALGGAGIAGTARVYDSDGERVLELRLDGDAGGQGFREVWLLDAEAGELVSLGVLNGTESTFTIPDGLDLGDFPIVDVSREPFNGDPAHSGDSIARGELDL